MESVGAVVLKNKLNLKNLEEVKIINLDDYVCPKVQFLIFKDKKYDRSCSNYSFCYAKTLHCAERKAFEYGQWSYVLLIKCPNYIEFSKNQT